MESVVSKEERKQRVNSIFETVEYHYSTLKNILHAIRDSSCNCEATRVITAFQRSDSPSKLMNNVCQILQEIKNICDFLKSGRCNVHTHFETLVSNQIFELTQLKNDLNQNDECNDASAANHSNNYEEVDMSTEDETEQTSHVSDRFHRNGKSRVQHFNTSVKVFEVVEPVENEHEEIDESSIKEDLKFEECFVKMVQVSDFIIKIAKIDANAAILRMTLIENGSNQIVVKKEKSSPSIAVDDSTTEIDDSLESGSETDGDENSLENAIKVVAGEDGARFICLICKSDFSSRKVALSHLRIHSSVNNLNCVLCDETFNDKNDLRSHILNAHVKVTSRSKNQSPGIKHNSSEVKSSANGHVKNKRRKTRRSSMSSELSENEDNSVVDVSQFFERINHNGTHSNSSPKKMKRKSVNIEKNFKHLYSKIKSCGKKFQCPVCNEQYKLRWRLNIHLNVHITGNELECSYCRKEFTSMPNIKRHTRKCRLKHAAPRRRTSAPNSKWPQPR